jgi:hypothetical protein
MEKRDTIVIIVAIIIVLIMAMYIKPLVTGQPVKLIPDELAKMFGGGNQIEIANNTTFLNQSSKVANTSSFEIPHSSNKSVNASANMSPPTPSPTPTWSGTPVQVGLQGGSSSSYIYPREYPVDPDTRYSFSQESFPLIPYTTFTGKNSVKTNPIEIPTGYWELWYTVDMKDDLLHPDITKKSESKEKTSEGKKIIPESMDSISVVYPWFSIRVENADSGSEVRYITPPGGLNPRLWKGDFVSPDADEPEDTPREYDSGINWDPRPWKEKFFEGYQKYTLDIDARNLISYKVEIKVPDPKSPLYNRSAIPDESSNQTSTGDLMENVFITYIEGVNGNISDPLTFEKIISSLSYNTLSQYSRDDIFKAINRMKYAGVTITGFSRTDDFIRGPEGSLKGNLAYTTGTGERMIFIDIPFVKDYYGWKINDLLLIKT